LAFWILIYAIVYGGLSAVRAIVKPHGYIEGAVATGAEPNYTMSFLTKEVPIVFLGLPRFRGEVRSWDQGI
jgi:hypothetical protein